MEKIECQSQSNRDFSFYDLSRLAFITGEEYLAISVLEKYENGQTDNEVTLWSLLLFLCVIL